MEGRRLLAADITVISGAAGSGTLDHFLSAGNGTITVANDPGDTLATLSVGALQGVGPGNLQFENILTSSSGNLTFQATNALLAETWFLVHDHY